MWPIRKNSGNRQNPTAVKSGRLRFFYKILFFTIFLLLTVNGKFIIYLALNKLIIFMVKMVISTEKKVFILFPAQQDLLINYYL